MRKQDLEKSRINEGLADLAQKAEHDHEVQMARADLYKLAKYSIKLHDMLKSISEEEGLEGWQQAKITKASDYISSVYHNLDYDMKFNQGTLGEGQYTLDAQRKAVHASKAEKKQQKSTVKESDVVIDPDRVKAIYDAIQKYGFQKITRAMQKSYTREEYSAYMKAWKAYVKKKKAQSYKESLQQRLQEKAVSKDQQRAAGAALAAKRGDAPKSKLKGASKEMMKMSTKELEKFASTKHKGLPGKKS